MFPHTPGDPPSPDRARRVTATRIDAITWLVVPEPGDVITALELDTFSHARTRGGWLISRNRYPGMRATLAALRVEIDERRTMPSSQQDGAA